MACKRNIILFYSLFFFISTTDCYPQNDAQGNLILSIGNNHLFQSQWNPYNNQPFAALSYLWTPDNKKVSFDAGLSLSFDMNNCDKCVSAANSSELTYDADIFTLHFGIGKWWKKQKTSAFLLGGVIVAASDYRKYFPATNGSYYDFIDSNRLHTGLYLKSGLDWKMNQHGLRVGPFIETRISTGQTDQNLNLNINSMAAGLMIGLQKGITNKISRTKKE